MSESSVTERAMEVARRLGSKVFAGDRDKDAKVADGVSVAWELSQKAPCHVSPTQIARYAIRRVRVGRQFRQSVRSIDSPYRAYCRLPRVSREDRLDVAEFAGKHATPEQVVSVRLDTEVWWMGLTSRQRAMAEMLAVGNTASETASEFGVSVARISQVRRELWEKWTALQD